MATVYFDTSVVLKLVVEEPASLAVREFVARRRLSVPVSRLTELEVENALQALCFRNQISPAQLAAARDLVAALHEEGRFRRLAVPLDRVAIEALGLAPVVTRRSGCRTLDLMHVATAKLLGSVGFVSTDRRQLEAARTCGLKAVDPTSDK